MNWTVPWILKQPNKSFVIDETIVFPKEMYQHVEMLQEIRLVTLNGKATYYDKDDRVVFDLEIEADMILKCAVSLEPVPYMINIQQQLIFSYRDDEMMDVYLIKKEKIDLMPIIIQLVLMEIPMRVVKEDIEMKMSGDGWQIIEEFEQTHIDPRFAKLSQLFKEKEEE